MAYSFTVAFVIAFVMVLALTRVVPIALWLIMRWTDTGKAIRAVAKEKLGIAEENLEPYGHYKAKVSMNYIKSLASKPNGKLILYASESGGRGILAAVSSDGRVKQRLV